METEIIRHKDRYRAINNTDDHFLAVALCLRDADILWESPDPQKDSLPEVPAAEKINSPDL